jgi:hypothetical protein
VTKFMTRFDLVQYANMWIKWKTVNNMLYPAAFMPVLVDIALVGVVVPLDAVHRGSSADVPSRSSNHEQ